MQCEHQSKRASRLPLPWSSYNPADRNGIWIDRSILRKLKIAVAPQRRTIHLVMGMR